MLFWIKEGEYYRYGLGVIVVSFITLITLSVFNDQLTTIYQDAEDTFYETFPYSSFEGIIDVYYTNHEDKNFVYVIDINDTYYAIYIDDTNGGYGSDFEELDEAYEFADTFRTTQLPERIVEGNAFFGSVFSYIGITLLIIGCVLIGGKWKTVKRICNK